VGKQRINKTTLAYIAGFLDGDGSILLQFKPSKRQKILIQLRSFISIQEKTDKDCFKSDRNLTRQWRE
jgi:intein-encoded DNA endonuclease-like protein